MPRLKNRAPAYCLHKATGQARVRINGRDHYLGPFGSRESRAQYDQLIADWRAGGQSGVQYGSTVSHLCLGYWEHCQRCPLRTRPSGQFGADELATDET